MYREADFDVEQLVTSLAGADRERKACKRQFESSKLPQSLYRIPIVAGHLPIFGFL